MKPSAYPLMEVDDALRLVLDRVPHLDSEEVPLSECRGRFLAADVVADTDLPRWPLSAVDGYAIRSTDGGGRLVVVGESAAGRPFLGSIPPGGAVTILTGGVVPEDADTVVMVEDVQVEGQQVVVPEGFGAGRNFHRPGDDIGRGEVALRRGTRLGPAELGLAATLGRARLAVGRQPRVALVSTGDELVDPGRELVPGQIFDSNRWALRASLLEAGAVVVRHQVARDEAGGLRAAVVASLAEADVLVTSGGVSVGTHDLVKPLLAELGEIHVGRVRMRPGKPFTFATLGGKVAFGLPGFPVSSLVTFEVLVRPALLQMQGAALLDRMRVPVRLGYPAAAGPERTDFQRVSLRLDGRDLVAELTGAQASSRLSSLVGAQALVRIPPQDEPLREGSWVEAILLS